MSNFNLQSVRAGRGEVAQRHGKLNTQSNWNEALQRLRSHIIQSDERGLPRYGVLSILARRVPFHLYDHPALEALCRTAFTDGIHVFVNTAFFRGVTTSAEQSDSMTLILLHELSHILFCHHARLPANAPPLLWAIACDIAINSRLLAGYPQLRPGTVFDDAWGTRPRERETYLGQSEEHILHGLWEEPTVDDADFVARLKAALSSPQGVPDPESDQRGQPQQVHAHLVPPELLARTLDDNGLHHIRAVLQLPDPNDKPAFQSLGALSALYLTADLDKAKEIRETHPVGGAMAGEHLEETSIEWIDNSLQGRVEWRSLLRDLVLGEGVRYEHSDEEPSDIYFVDPVHMGLDAPLYLGSQLPAGPAGVVVCIVDTSRSVSVDLLKIFIAELNNLVEHECVEQNQIYIVSADTAIRTDVVSFAAHEMAHSPEQICMHGRGGTDMTRVINEVLQWTSNQREFALHELGALVYFTDLLDRAPSRDALPEQLPELLFLSPPTPAVRGFRRRIEDFASIAEIRDGTVIDLCRS